MRVIKVMESKSQPDFWKLGLKALQVSDDVWLVPCKVNLEDNEYSPLLKPFCNTYKQKSRHTWATEEDQILVAIIEQRGPKNWIAIACEFNSQLYGGMPVRQAKQCRERWFNHLNPTLTKGNWRVTEDIYILKKQIELGNRWSEIAKGMEGRTENCVKNRWKCMLKKAKHEHPNAPNVLNIILADREQKLKEDLEPSHCESVSHLKASLKLKFSPEQLCLSEDSQLNLKSEYQKCNTQQTYKSSDVSTLDTYLPTSNFFGFSQYAEFQKHFSASQPYPSRETDCCYSPSMFIRSPH